jgi:hypothetical protein
MNHRSRRERVIDYWPGFVDALSTLVLGIIFLLTVFVVVQFFLSQELAGKDTALVRLNAQISQLTDLLALEKAGKVDMEDEIARLRASLSDTGQERDPLKTAAEKAGSDAEILAPNFGPRSDRIAFPHTRETDCVAFELRCAERMFISLRNRRASDLRRGAQTFAPSGRIIFSAGLDCLLFACAFVERRTQQQVP